MLLGYGMAPSFVVVREPQIPDGSVEIPADVGEMEVVVDQNTPLARWSTFAAFAASQVRWSLSDGKAGVLGCASKLSNYLRT